MTFDKYTDDISAMLLLATVVSNYRFYQEGLIWHCHTLQVHYFLFNAKTKTYPVPESLLGEILNSALLHHTAVSVMQFRSVNFVYMAH